MSKRARVHRLVLVAGIAMGISSVGLTPEVASAQTAPGVISYQGQLPATGTTLRVDIIVRLYNSTQGGIELAQPQSVTKVWVGPDGRYTLPLNFGSTVWNGDDRYLDIAVRSPSGSTNAYLRQPLRDFVTPVPYAMYALNGPAGPQGETGPQGPQGPAGLQGPAGVAGLRVRRA